MGSISPDTTIVTNHDHVPDHDHDHNHEHDDSDNTLYSGLPYGTNNYNPATSDPDGPKNYDINFLLQFRLQMAHILARAPRVVHQDHADSESEFVQLKGSSEPPEPVVRSYAARSGNRDRIRALGRKSRGGGGGSGITELSFLKTSGKTVPSTSSAVYSVSP